MSNQTRSDRSHVFCKEQVVYQNRPIWLIVSSVLKLKVFCRILSAAVDAGGESVIRIDAKGTQREMLWRQGLGEMSNDISMLRLLSVRGQQFANLREGFLQFCEDLFDLFAIDSVFFHLPVNGRHVHVGFYGGIFDIARMLSQQSQQVVGLEARQR